MKHRKYEGIDGVWSQKVVDWIRLKGFADEHVRWCVTEKVHGSNFSFYMSQDEFRVSKRNGFIKEGENFFQYTRMKESNGYKIRQLWDYLVSVDEMGGNIGELKELIVYGELCGGAYDHPDVEKPKNVRKIQKGVNYAPDIIFYCFDIMINGEFQNMFDVQWMCKACDIFVAEILQVGTFDECLEHSNEFQTKIPARLGLPSIDNNICEGVVLKPIYPKYFKDGSRVIVKSKNAKFLEVSREGKPKRAKKAIELSEHAKNVLDVVSGYITENRLLNVISNFGKPEKRDFRVVWQLFKDDVLKDYFKDFQDDILDVDRPIIMKLIGRLCTEVWKPVFLKIT